MSDEQRIKIPRASDTAIIDCFKKIGKEYDTHNIRVSALASINIGEVNLSSNENADFEALLKHKSTLIALCSLQVKGLNITYHRGGQYEPQDKSPIFDEILLKWNTQQGNLSNKDKLNIVFVINSELKAFEPGRFVNSGLSEEQSQLLSIHSSTLDRLQKLNEDLISKGSEFREDIEKRYEKKSAELELQIKNQKEKLDQDHEQKTKKLEEREKTLSDKLAAIDDRDNTHVRREIRDHMLSDVKARIEKFGVSESTEGKRRPVFFGIMFMIVVILGMLSYTALEMSQLASPLGNTGANEPPIIYWLWVKIMVLSLSLLGTILYYIKWQNKWAEQHASSEFQLQQFHIDVNRANWVIESCLEWQKETDSIIPTALLENIARNLFDRPNEELEKVIHPSDELASALLGSASRLKMKVGDSELEFDKPGKIKPTKSSAS